MIHDLVLFDDQMLKKWAYVELRRENNLKYVKEKALDELRYFLAKLKKTRLRDDRIRDNRIFREDQGMFYRKTQGMREKKGNAPHIAKFEEFWTGILEGDSKMPHRKWMSTTAQKIRAKVVDIQDFAITEERMHSDAKRRKKWSAPGIDGIQNYWWKKLKGTWKSLLNCYNRWVEQPDEIPQWLAQRKTVLMPKSKELGNEKNYRLITCLNTCYKIFTGMIGNYMQEHAARNDIWDKCQLGTSSGVLGTVDQLIIDRAIMDEVKGQQRNLAVAFYDYQKAYDMVRYDWMIRFYQWMGIPEKLIEVLKELMKR